MIWLYSFLMMCLGAAAYLFAHRQGYKTGYRDGERSTKLGYLVPGLIHLANDANMTEGQSQTLRYAANCIAQGKIL
jgi:hypothetical protein